MSFRSDVVVSDRERTMVLNDHIFSFYKEQIVCVNDNLWSVSLSFSLIVFISSIERKWNGMNLFLYLADFPLEIEICEAYCTSIVFDPCVTLYSIGINALHDSESFISNWKCIWVDDFCFSKALLINWK